MQRPRCNSGAEDLLRREAGKKRAGEQEVAGAPHTEKKKESSKLERWGLLQRNVPSRDRGSELRGPTVEVQHLAGKDL